MKSTRQFSVTLPDDMAEAVQHKIESGAYASVSDVMHAGVEALLDKDAAVERWLRQEVVAGHAEYVADTSRGIPAEEVMDRIRRRRASSGAR